MRLAVPVEAVALRAVYAAQLSEGAMPQGRLLMRTNGSAGGTLSVDEPILG